MKLDPTEPPGRATRKARHFEDGIVQLRAQGYTLDAIRRALASVGVQVSISTVRREANRHAVSTLKAALGVAAHECLDRVPPLDPAACAARQAPLTSVAPADGASGKDHAEAFLRSQITNPLLRAKEHP